MYNRPYRRERRENVVERLKRELIKLVEEMFEEGLLDDQFRQLQQLQDESNPEFVGEVIGLFFDDSEKLLEDLTEEIEKEPIDFKKLDAFVHQFKGSSSSIGAQKVKEVCIEFRTCCDEEDREGCIQELERVKEEYYLVKDKLELMLELEQKILDNGGTLPVFED